MFMKYFRSSKKDIASFQPRTSYINNSSGENSANSKSSNQEKKNILSSRSPYTSLSLSLGAQINGEVENTSAMSSRKNLSRGCEYSSNFERVSKKVIGNSFPHHEAKGFWYESDVECELSPRSECSPRNSVKLICIPSGEQLLETVSSELIPIHSYKTSNSTFCEKMLSNLFEERRRNTLQEVQSPVSQVGQFTVTKIPISNRKNALQRRFKLSDDFSDVERDGCELVRVNSKRMCDDGENFPSYRTSLRSTTSLTTKLRSISLGDDQLELMRVTSPRISADEKLSFSKDPSTSSAPAAWRYNSESSHIKSHRKVSSASCVRKRWMKPDLKVVIPDKDLPLKRQFTDRENKEDSFTEADNKALEKLCDAVSRIKLLEKELSQMEKSDCREIISKRYLEIKLKEAMQEANNVRRQGDDKSPNEKDECLAQEQYHSPKSETYSDRKKSMSNDRVKDENKKVGTDNRESILVIDKIQGDKITLTYENDIFQANILQNFVDRNLRKEHCAKVMGVLNQTISYMYKKIDELYKIGSERKVQWEEQLKEYCAQITEVRKEHQKGLECKDLENEKKLMNAKVDHHKSMDDLRSSMTSRSAILEAALEEAKKENASLRKQLKDRIIRQEELEEEIAKLENDCTDEATEALRLAQELVEARERIRILEFTPLILESASSNKKLERENHHLRTSHTDLLGILDKKDESEKEKDLKIQCLTLDCERLQGDIMDLRRELDVFRKRRVSEPGGFLRKHGPCNNSQFLVKDHYENSRKHCRAKTQIEIDYMETSHSGSLTKPSRGKVKTECEVCKTNVLYWQHSLKRSRQKSKVFPFNRSTWIKSITNTLKTKDEDFNEDSADDGHTRRDSIKISAHSSSQSQSHGNRKDRVLQEFCNSDSESTGTCLHRQDISIGEEYINHISMVKTVQEMETDKEMSMTKSSRLDLNTSNKTQIYIGSENILTESSDGDQCDESPKDSFRYSDKSNSKKLQVLVNVDIIPGHV